MMMTSRLLAPALLVLAALGGCTRERHLPDFRIEAPARPILEGPAADPRAVVRASGLLAVLLVQPTGDHGADLLVVRSRTGDDFEPPVRVNTAPGEVRSHAEASPQLLPGPGMKLCAAWVGAPPGGDGGLRVSCSSDFGQSFPPPATVPTGRVPSFFSVGLGPTGTLLATWFDSQGATKGTARLMASSSEDGKTFTEPRELARDVCPCCRPVIGASGARWMLAFRGIAADGSRDIVLARSADNGRTWSMPVPVSPDRWTVEGCPHSGPALAWAGERLFLAWYTGAGGRAAVRWTRSHDGGATFAPARELQGDVLDPNHPSLAVLDGRVFAAFEGRDASEQGGFGPRRPYVVELGPERARPQRLPSSGPASYPVLAPLGPGTLLSLWTERAQDGSARVLTSRLRLP